MRHYVFLKKNQIKPLDNIKIYGSVKALLENEEILINESIPNYNRVMYLLGENHSWENQNYLIKRCDVIHAKSVLKK